MNLGEIILHEINNIVDKKLLEKYIKLCVNHLPFESAQTNI